MTHLIPFYKKKRLTHLDIPKEKSVTKKVILMVRNETTFCGGLSDRFRGITSVYRECKSQGIDFKIHFETPNLIDYLEPNEYDWYIKDLMVCSICSPIIYYLIRKTGMIYILLIGCLYLTNTWINIAGFDARAWFFFSFGAYLSLNNINMVCLLRRYAIIIIPIAITLLVITTYYNHVLTDIQPILNNIFLLFGVTALIGGFSYLVSKGIVRDIPFLTKSVFFIYAFHVLPLPGIPSITTLCKNLAEKSIVETQILTYFMQLTLCPIAVLSACLITYYFMRRLTPKLLSVLTGQR